MVEKVVMTGTIVSSDGGYSLKNGAFAGRWPIDTLLVYIADATYNLERMENPNTTPVVDCLGDRRSDTLTSFEIQKTCALVDIRVEGDDRTAPCDGLSFGSDFDGVPATLGTVVSNAVEPCPNPYSVKTCETIDSLDAAVPN
jgi:hypothetical protein